MNATDRPPNIVFIFSDQQRWDTLGCFGQKLDVTPNLDRLAGEGVRFAQTFTCQPVCGPARACLQTGKFATELGCFRNNVALPLNERTIAHAMGDAGYDLAYLGKWHLASNGAVPRDGAAPEENYRQRAVPPERRGGWNGYWLAADALEVTSHGYEGYLFDGAMRRVDFTGYRADRLTDFTLDYLGSRQGRSKPFFLFVSYLEPHHQNDHNHFEGPHGSQERFRDFVVPGDLDGTGGDWRAEYADYLGCCASLDQNVGRIRAELERQGLLENTLFIYTSDHGCHFRTRNGEYKRSCHDSSIHIPLIACGPGFTGGRVVNELVSLIDLPPTILSAASLTPPTAMRGHPLQRLAAGEVPRDWPDDVFVQISESQVGRAIRTARWTYSVRAPQADGWTVPASQVYAEDCLYDNDADPHQRHNLVREASLTAVRAELAARLRRRMAEAGEGEPHIMPADGAQ